VDYRSKAPNEPITGDDIQQAYTYAVHPEVAAGFFVLCNGRRLVVFKTINGPTANPVIDFSYEEFDSHWQIIANMLGLIASGAQFFRSRRHPQALAKGMASTAHVVAGVLEYSDVAASFHL